jgi:hypothetical protein
MRRHRAVISVALVLVALVAIVVGGIALAGDDGEGTTTSPAPTEAPAGRATPPNAPGQLPPEFVQCMADQGFDINSADEIHSAPPQVLQACFGSLHQGGAAP